MRLKTVLITLVLLIIGFVVSSFFVGEVYLTQVVPFETIQDQGIPGKGVDPNIVRFDSAVDVTFVSQDLLKGWIPWIIKQLSILIGGISLVVFIYAGIRLIINGDNEEEFGKAIKIIVFAIIGIALSALSYAIVANVLALFT